MVDVVVGQAALKRAMHAFLTDALGSSDCGWDSGFSSTPMGVCKADAYCLQADW